MKRGRSKLDWLVLENEDDEFPASPVPVTPPRRRYRSVLLGGIRVVFAGLLIGGNALVHTADQGLESIDRELEATIALEEWATAPSQGASNSSAEISRTVKVPFVGDTPSESARQKTGVETQVLEITFSHDLAVVQVLESRVYPDGQTESLQRLRFYRYDGQEWVRTAPDEGYWGAPMTLETERFVFKYRKQDHSVVARAAPAIDAAAIDLRAALGLPPPAGKVTVTVYPGSNGARAPSFVDDELQLISPTLLPIPIGLTAQQLLTWQAIGPFATHTLDEAKAAQPIYGEWRYMAEVIERWLLLQHNELQTAWRDDLLAWRRDVYAAGAPENATLATAGLADLCAKHHIWERIVWFQGSGIGAHCLSPASAAPASLIDIDTLAQLWQPETLDLYPFYTTSAEPVDAALVTTIVDYMVLTYGRESLPRLWRGFGAYHTWDTLIPVVFGVSAETFERGWQEYQLQPLLCDPLPSP